MPYQDDTVKDFNEASSILIPVGTIEDDALYSKSTTIQMWLFGYELPDTLTLITKDKVTFVSSQKKGAILEQLIKEGSSLQIQVLKRSKDETENKAIFKQVLELMNATDSKNVGIFPKDKFNGKFITEWTNAREEYETKFKDVDVSVGVANVLAVKDEDELKLIKSACRLSTQVMSKSFISDLEAILDEDKKIKHDEFADTLEKVLQEKYRKQLKISNEIDLESAELCYPPIIQSGGEYDLKASAESNSKFLHAGVIICSLGVKYKSYCSNIARTFLVDPEKQKEKNYKFLQEVSEYVFSCLKDGTTCKEVYLKALGYIEKKRPELKDKFVKNIGFGMGIEFREAAYLLGPKNNRELRDGMIFSVSIGFQNLEVPEATDEKMKNYSLLLIDTVKITDDKCVVLTSDVTKETIYIFKDPEAEVADNEKKEEKKAEPPTRKTAILPSKLRGEEKPVSNELQRKNHQKELAALRNEEGKKRFSAIGEKSGSDEKQVFKKFESYKKESQIPNETRDLRVLVDRRNFSVILPIYDLAVPFHVSTLKNVSKTDDKDFTYLRFNFITPGQSFGKKVETVVRKSLNPFQDPNATFVRALTFKSSDAHRFAEIFREINELKKEMQKKEVERLEMSDLVQQDKLIEIRGKRPFRLIDVYCRPVLEGKKFPGELEIHSNGLRYMNQVRNDQRIDILFSNIKHLFLQPCNHELLIILHIHLKNPIMIGKKKTRDIQFYREVQDANFDETGNRKRRYNYGDEDELQAEQEERKRRSMLNREFKDFAAKITEASRNIIEVDVPFRDLAFSGVPHRQLVLMQPTTDCLVHLTEPPFVVITLADIEIVHLERVQFGLKNFDMVVVFKDFSKPVFHINTIPTTSLDAVKEWLDNVDVAFTEGPVNLNWIQIMKTINEDPAGFFAEEGWGFLQLHSDGETDESDSASEFEASGSDFGSEHSSDYSGSGSGSGSNFGSDDSGSEEGSGEDWDELERKAEKSDQKKRAMDGEDSEEDNRKKKIRR
ncbi:FACT complex subunit spt16 [Clydaea vesicula]|uniref:FACT complex subunit n=1 Tax=Clydaea vesicula TaxID=447962 RepID=A0AAD5TWC2_9FUNG|nr:FACT complex subunit spt16 [Clydaea vesicula]